MTVDNAFVARYRDVVRTIAARYKTYGCLELEDLIQEGYIGLIIAAERYEDNYGIRFASYAAWWVRKYITEAIRRYGYSVTLPQHRPDEHVYTEPLDRVVAADEDKLLTYEDILRSREPQPDETLEMQEAFRAYKIAKNHAKMKKKRFDFGKWHQKYVNK